MQTIRSPRKAIPTIVHAAAGRRRDATFLGLFPAPCCPCTPSHAVRLRRSFDRATGKLFAGDVGQNSFEEVDIITKAGNFGWNKMEASHCYPPGSVCSTAGLIPPIM